MNAETSNRIKDSLTIYAPCIILVIGNIGCLLNLITFTFKQLRTNPCGWYFLMSAIADIWIINFGLITKFVNDRFGCTLYSTSHSFCKIRIFLTWTMPCISTAYLVLAAIDRYLSTSKNTRFRSLSRMHVAYRITIVPIILYSLTGIHQFFFFDLRPNCAAQTGVYSIFLAAYSIIWTSLIPQTILLICGICTYRNVRASRNRLSHGTEQQKSRTDMHLIKITLLQVLSSLILLNLRTTYYAYTVLSAEFYKGVNQIAFESLILEVSSFIFYINFCKSFYVNTLTSRLFRQVLTRRIAYGFNLIRPNRFRIYPANISNHAIY